MHRQQFYTISMTTHLDHHVRPLQSNERDLKRPQNLSHDFSGNVACIMRKTGKRGKCDRDQAKQRQLHNNTATTKRWHNCLWELVPFVVKKHVYRHESSTFNSIFTNTHAKRWLQAASQSLRVSRHPSRRSAMKMSFNLHTKLLAAENGEKNNQIQCTHCHYSS